MSANSGSGGSGPGFFRYKIGTTILVTGLDNNIRKTDLQGAFGEYGQIIRLDVTGVKAYLEYDESRDAKDAVAMMDGQTIKGCRLRVELKTQSETPAARQERQGRQALAARVQEDKTSEAPSNPQARARPAVRDHNRSRSRSSPASRRKRKASDRSRSRSSRQRRRRR
eukprot:gnl/TRDRNA2_/TRDRNA2_29385_c0_seq1.p1 gnl/TRDRNA2_/TRDRNA2_29385_c0~~gnl/TRDRNA2_/TRDRNA2_29385_c0_seq1.p1  ORF type:complete len:176 (-),score=30.85 gnl/TRDRNA2_/TRDRNA2_29385_c0_seq1:98-601(-)